MPPALGWFAASGREEAGLWEKKEARTRAVYCRGIPDRWCCFGSQDELLGGTGLMHVGEPSAVEGIWSLLFFLCWHLAT